MKPTFKVRQGIVHINAIKVLRAEENVVLVEIDFKNKWPEVDSLGNGAIFFGAGSLTFGVVDRSLPAACVEIGNLPPSWYDEHGEFREGLRMAYYIGKYSAFVVWIREDEEKLHDGPVWYDVK